jgi:hypothetical protein
MKLKYLFIILSTSILIGCTKKNNTLKNYNFKGKVHKVYENTYDAENKFGKWQIGDKKNYGHSLMTFNENGYLTESISYDKENKILQRDMITYDDENILSSNNIIDSDGKLVSKYIYTKDSENRIIKTQQYDSDGKIKETYKLIYNSSDRTIKGKLLNNEGKLETSWENEWDDDLLIMQLIFNGHGKLQSKSYFEYNENGDIRQTKFTTASDSITDIIKIIYDYDNEYNWIKKSTYDKEGKIDAIVTRRIVYFGGAGSNLNDKKIIGIWQEIGENDWIEFKKDGTYDKGYNDKIRDFGIWEMNDEQNILTLKSEDKDRSKKYSYSYDEDKLILSTIDGSDRIEYIKR